MSKNNPTIGQLIIACRHVNELMRAGMGENLAIRTLELLTDIYASVEKGGKAKVWHAKDVPPHQWSLAALRAEKRYPRRKTGSYLRVEHGTPRRDFARAVRKLYSRHALTVRDMTKLINRRWKMAVITHEEDARLKRRKIENPRRRWAAAGIRFPKKSPFWFPPARRRKRRR